MQDTSPHTPSLTLAAAISAMGISIEGDIDSYVKVSEADSSDNASSSLKEETSVESAISLSSSTPDDVEKMLASITNTSTLSLSWRLVLFSFSPFSSAFLSLALSLSFVVI